MGTCSVAECDVTRRNNPNNYTFHRFPNNVVLRDKWIRILNRDGWTPNKNTTICSKHFESKYCIQRKLRRVLLKDTIPTLFVPIQLKRRMPCSYVNRDILLPSVDPLPGPSRQGLLKKKKSERTNKSSERLPAEQEDEIKVFCPKCDTEVSHSAEGIQNDQTKIIIAKVYHYFEQEYEELKKMCEGLDLTPLSKFRQRTALATGVSESTVLEILQEEERRKAKEPHVQLLVQREARKRSRQSESSSEEDSFESDDDDDEQLSTDHATDILVVKEEPLEISNEEPEIYGELAVVKGEPGVSAANEELADPLVVNVKIEPHSEEATDSNETHAVQPASKRYKGRTPGRSTEAPPGPSAPPSSSALPGPSAPPGPSASPGTFAPSGTCERVLLPLEVGEIKFEDIEIKEEGFS